MWQYNHELYHFGVLGMKWGVRKYQNKDGSLTSAGKKRYADDSSTSSSPKKKSTHRSRLEEKYRKKGMSEKEAAIAAEKRIRTERVIAAVAGVTVAACAIYAAKKYVSNRTDRVLKSGIMAQRVDTVSNLNDTFYMSYKQKDNSKYVGLFGLGKKKLTLEATGDVKVASRQKAAETFKELMKNDKDFAKDVLDTNVKLYSPRVGKKQLQARDALMDSIKDNKYNKLTKKAYDGFNLNLVDRNASREKFFNALKAKGYDAIEDMNDKKMSGFDADALIVFNKNKFSVKSVENLKNSEVMEKGVEFWRNKKIKRDLTVRAFAAASAGTIAAGSVYVNGAQAKYEKTKTEKEKP